MWILCRDGSKCSTMGIVHLRSQECCGCVLAILYASLPNYLRNEGAKFGRWQAILHKGFLHFCCDRWIDFVKIPDWVPDCAIDDSVMDNEDVDDFQQSMAATIKNLSRCTSNSEWQNIHNVLHDAGIYRQWRLRRFRPEPWLLLHCIGKLLLYAPCQ